MSDWNLICRVEDIPVLGSRCVARPQGMDVAVFRNDQDQVFALLDRCPHKGGPLSQGIVFGTSVACPLHNWTIGLDDGCAKAPDEGCAQRFSVKVEGGEVYLNVLELASLATDAVKPVAGPQCRHPHPSPLPQAGEGVTPHPPSTSSGQAKPLPQAGEGARWR